MRHTNVLKKTERKEKEKIQNNIILKYLNLDLIQTKESSFSYT